MGNRSEQKKKRKEGKNTKFQAGKLYLGEIVDELITHAATGIGRVMPQLGLETKFGSGRVKVAGLANREGSTWNHAGSSCAGGIIRIPVGRSIPRNTQEAKHKLLSLRAVETIR